MQPELLQEACEPRALADSERKLQQAAYAPTLPGARPSRDPRPLRLRAALEDLQHPI